jgi:hypothetical protein
VQVVRGAVLEADDAQKSDDQQYLGRCAERHIFWSSGAHWLFRVGSDQDKFDDERI